jgi:glyoxylase-like metal-dependent hydrolase (beta-lactamase superfamily II)
MRRAIVLVALITVGAALSASQQPPAPAGGQKPMVVEVEKLKENLFVLRGGGGNSTVFVQANGVLVVDTKNPGWGTPLLAKIKELTPKPVTTIVNTHTHGDHVSGNVEFPTTVEVVVQENTEANMKEMRPVTGIAKPGTPPGPNIFKDNGGKGMPKRTFKDRLTIGSGNDRVELYYFGRGHTNGDAWVLFPALRVVSAGDIFAWKDQLPLLDRNSGGSARDMPDTLMKAHTALIKSADSIVTGHSTVMTFDDLKQWADFNRGFLNQMREAKKAGRSPEEVAKSYTPPAGITVAANQALRLQENVQTAFNEIK